MSNIQEIEKNMNCDKKEKIPYIPVIIYVIALFAVWTVFEMLVKSYIEKSVDNIYISQIINSGIIKNLVWTIPAFLMLKKYDIFAQVKLKGLFTNRVKLLPYLLICLIMAAYVIAASLLQRHTLALCDTFNGSQLIIVLFVGLTEEMVFRGFLLNVTLTDRNKWIAVFVNALMFLSIHFPKWISDGVFINNITFGSVGIIILSIIFSISFIKSKNILVPITEHMLYDLFIFMWIGS